MAKPIQVPMTDFTPTPPARLPNLASTTLDSERLLQEMRIEQRSYMEEVENAVAETEAGSTSFDMRLMQLGSRSYEVDVELSDRQIRGRISHVSGEIATLETIGGVRFTLHIERIMAVRFDTDRPGETRGIETGAPSTLLARVRELWGTGERCTIGRTTGSAVLGDIQAVTEGHIEVIDHQKNSWLIPMATIAWIGPKL